MDQFWVLGPRRGDRGMPQGDSSPVRPAGAHAIGAAQLARGVMQDQVVVDHDAGMRSERRVQRHQEDITDLDGIVQHGSEALATIELVKVELWILPKPIGPRVVAQTEVVVVPEISPADREAVLLPGDVRKTDQVTVG